MQPDTREAQILALAWKATPGKWEISSSDTAFGTHLILPVTDHGRNEHYFSHGEDADYIAACEPQTIASAMRVIQAARKLANVNDSQNNFKQLCKALDAWDGDND